MRCDDGSSTVFVFLLSRSRRRCLLMTRRSGFRACRPDFIYESVRSICVGVDC